MDNTDIESLFDPKSEAERRGLTDRQFRFCMAYSRGGIAMWKAAKEAGFAGNGSILRGTATRVHKSKRVRDFLVWLREHAPPQPKKPPADYDTIESTLSDILESGDPNSKIRAGEVLHRIREARRTPDQDEPLEPAAAIEIIAGYSPDLAADLAAADGLPFTLSDEHRQRAAERHRAIAEHWIRDNPQRALQIASFFARGGGTHGAAA